MVLGLVKALLLVRRAASKRTELVRLYACAEPQGIALGDLEGLVHTGVDAKEGLATEIVALAGLSRIRKPQKHRW
jgi:hypothetical protein